MSFPFEYRVLEPRAPVRGRPPLLFLLHGIGADEEDLLPVAERLDSRLKVVSLRAPGTYYTGYSWFHIDWLPDGSVRPDPVQGKASLAKLVEALDIAPGFFGTDPDRTFLLGFSQGCMMGIGALGTAPDKLAGVMGLSGRYSPDLFPRTASDRAVAKVPLLVAHGTMDEVLPVQNGRQTKAAFEKLSADFTYREFDVGHGISPEEIDWIGGWLKVRLDR